MGAVKFSANEAVNLQKKYGNSSWVLTGEKKEFKITYSKMLYPVKQEKIKYIQIVEFSWCDIDKR